MSLNHTSIYAELTDQQFKMIGKIVVEWTNIEFLQKQILGQLLFTPEFLSRTFSDLITAARIQDAIKEAVALHRRRYCCKVINDEILIEIEQVNNAVTVARAHRNKFAHFCWCRSSDEEIFGTNFSGGLPDSKNIENHIYHLKMMSWIHFTVIPMPWLILYYKFQINCPK